VAWHYITMTAKRLKRPRDPVQLGKLVGDILTGQVEDREPAKAHPEAAEFARKGGLKGGKARAKKLTPQQRSEIAHLAAQARWKKR
jgi:hypothetical protein